MSSMARRNASRSSEVVPKPNISSVSAATPSLPGGSCSDGSLRTRPNTETVGLTCSGCTISRRPFGRTVTSGAVPASGAPPRAALAAASAEVAQSGSTTAWSGGVPTVSAPPNPALATGWPPPRGVRMAVTAASGSSSCLARRRTWAGVTAS